MSKQKKGQGHPSYPDAHPTAPGGMSQPALIEEMVAKHGWDRDEATALKWREQIDAVIQGRLDREAEAKEALVDLAEALTEPLADIAAEYDEAVGAVEAALDGVDVETVRATGTPVFADERGPEGYEPGDLVDVIHGRTEPAEPDEPTVIAPPTLMVLDPNTLDYSFSGHAGAGPSGAHRWMHCTASLGASRDFLRGLTPNQQAEFAKANTAARQGTTAHSVAEAKIRFLLGEINENELQHTLLELAIEPDAAGEAYDDEMDEHLSEYVDYAQQFIDAEREVRIEQRVSAIVPLTGMYDDEVYGVTGSADLVVLPSVEEPVLVVGDLKYGNGHDVDPDSNPQVRLYGLGVLSDLADEDGNLPDLERIEYAIVQPRLGGIKVWTESVEDLLTWRDEVLAPALTAALYGEDEGATYSPSEDACQWCPARGTCAALVESRYAQATDLFDVVGEAEFKDGPGAFPETGSLTDTRLGELLAQVEGLVSLKDVLKEEVQRRLHRGGSVPGYKLVSYSPKRNWVEGAAEALDPDHPDLGLTPAQAAVVWKKSLITPKQALAALKQAGADPEVIEKTLVETPPKRPVAASVHDKRKEWTGVPPEQMFNDESGNAESESVA